MKLKSEFRRSDTRSRTAVIEPLGHRSRRYIVTLNQIGKLVTREFIEYTPNITSARRVAQEWCQ